MKKKLNLKGIIFVILLGVIVNLLEGCTSIQDNTLLNSKVNINPMSTKSRNESTLTGSYKSSGNDEKTITLNYDDVKDSLIRFHVIANSDDEEDQNLKIKVKNEVIDYLYPYLNKSESVDESRKIIQDNIEEVKKIAEKVIKDNNYEYSVNVELSRENFPDKSYGNITLPQGNYEAFRIIIGEGEGKNWWCVMFPPLCFVDESKAEVEYEKTQNKIYVKQNIDNEANNSNNESEEATESGKHDEKNQNDIQIKFKIIEIVKNLFKMS